MREIRSRARTIDRIADVSGVSANLTINGELERVFAVSANDEALPMLGAEPPALGRLTRDRQDIGADGFISAVVISDACGAGISAPIPRRRPPHPGQQHQRRDRRRAAAGAQGVPARQLERRGRDRRVVPARGAVTGSTCAIRRRSRDWRRAPRSRRRRRSSTRLRAASSPNIQRPTRRVRVRREPAAGSADRSRASRRCGRSAPQWLSSC